ncbi:MAG: recombination-associated protein RdgC [Desulfovermiculus sp.]|nr:recombination-associated protein RdgC [Desulfovermiculus sp.]
MGIMSASGSFTRYRIVEEVPQGLWLQIQDRLVQDSFQEIEDTADEFAYGWVSIEDMLDSAWASGTPFKGEYVAFALRLDTRRIPAAVFKKYYQLGLQEAMAKAKEQGRKFVGREAKKELKENVKLWLLRQILPVPSVFDVVWNMQTNRILLGSTQNTARTLFEDLFTKSFELHLEPLTPFFLAAHMGGEKVKEKLEAYEPVVFV